MKLSSLRVGLRLGRRELRARPARAFLVILLIIVPTAAMTVVTTFQRTSETSADEFRANTFGTASYRAYFAGHHPDAYSIEELTDADIDALRQSVPAGTPFLVENMVADRVRGADFVEGFSLTDVDLTDPLVQGRYTLLEGHAPANATEAVVNRELARSLHLRVGSSVKPDRLGTTLHVVGIMEAGQGYDLYLVTRAPLPPRASTAVFIGETPRRPSADGWVLDSGYPGTLSHTDRVLWTYVGGTIGLFVLGTIVAAAFALGARRQLRTIGLLSATGAPPRTVAWALTAQGAFAGAVGSVIGIALGVIGVRLLPLSLLQSVTAKHATSAITRPTDLIPIAVIGILAAMGAAAFPARAASRLAVLQALASRRPVNRARRGSWFAALAFLAAGAGALVWGVRARDDSQSNLSSLTIVIGSVLPFVSALIAAPLVVGRLEHWAGSAPLPWRLAGRSLARNRARSASVVGATCAVVGLVVAGTSLARSWEPDIDPNASVGSAVYQHVYLQPNQALAYAEHYVEPDAHGNVPDPSDARLPVEPVDDGTLVRMRALIPSAHQVDLVDLRGSDGFRPNYRLDISYGDFSGASFGQTPVLAVASPELLELFDVSPALRKRLAAGDVIVVRSPGTPQITNTIGEALNGATLLHVGGVAESREAALALPQVLIDANRAAKLGWHTAPAGVTVFASPQAFTPAERRQLRLLALDLQWEYDIAQPPGPGEIHDTTGINVGDPPSREVSVFLLRLLAFAATSALVLAVVGLGLGLSARDNHDETAVLDAVGAPPRVRRQVGTRRAVLLVVVACAIAIPAGIIPIAALVTSSAHTDDQFRIDWFAFFALTVALPLVVASVAAGGGWLRDRLRRPRPDVLAFAD